MFNLRTHERRTGTQTNKVQHLMLSYAINNNPYITMTHTFYQNKKLKKKKKKKKKKKGRRG